jgi:eukaryotic-like serine/threonine-protein kinase
MGFARTGIRESRRPLLKTNALECNVIIDVLLIRRLLMRPAECLTGFDLTDGWHVESILHRPPTSTGGKFSVGYLVRNKDGREAYLKALDFSVAFQHSDPSRALQEMTSAYNFERDLLGRCRDRKLKRVVTPLADGNVHVSGNFGPLGTVFYLIFERASGDIRDTVGNWEQFDLAWSLRSLHHTATGLRQLHSTGIAHQDLKPSNVLVFPSDGSKVADLGRASSAHTPSPTDDLLIPGDVGYSPPEQWYNWRPCQDFGSRYLADLYLLGNLVFFHFTRCSATQTIKLKISQMHSGHFRNSEFLQDLPYIQQAFSEALSCLRDELKGLAGDLTDEIIMIARQLCEPDPRRRGDPKIFQSRIPQSDLQPYISRFDRLATRVEMRMI